MGQNEPIFVRLSSSISTMEANKIAESFPNFERENSIGVKEDKNTEKRSFWLILRAKTLFSKNAQNQGAKLIFSKKKAKFFYLILLFNDNLAKEARRLKSKIYFDD